MRVELDREVWERFDEEEQRLWRLELAGRLPEGSVVRWHDELAATVDALEDAPERFPAAPEWLDPAGMGFRTAPVGEHLRLDFLIRGDVVLGAQLRHTRERPREILDRS